MKFFQLIIAIIMLLAGSLQAADTSTKTNKKSTVVTKKEKPEMTKKEMQKKIHYLESEIIKLWRLTLYLRKITPRYYTMSRIARKEAAIMINKYLGIKSKSGSRIAVTYSRGGITIPFLFAGNDRINGISLPKAGIKLVMAARGKRFMGDGTVLFWALPVSDMVVRNKYLIYRDDSVPYISGAAQIHFYWKGKFMSGKKVLSGKYKIFAQINVRNKKMKTMGYSKRFWGASYAGNKKKYYILIK